MTDEAIKSGMKALAARIVALESKIAELESAPVKSTRKPKDTSEVCAYFKEHGLNGTAQAEAERFFNFYNSKGWKVGKSPMTKWKSAAANWIQGKVEAHVEIKRKPEIDKDFYLKDRGDGIFEKYWIRAKEKTSEVFRTSDWEEEMGMRA